MKDNMIKIRAKYFLHVEPFHRVSPEPRMSSGKLNILRSVYRNSSSETIICQYN